jgi:hypothetical protein
VSDEKEPIARITIVHEFPLRKANYRYSGGPLRDEKLTDEQLAALDGKAMLELEKGFLEEHLTDLDDILSGWDPTTDEADTIKWELVEDAD